MSFTKIGATLLQNAKNVGGNLWKATGTAAGYAFPAVTTALAANDIMSGQRSVGEAIGEAAGGAAGYFGTRALTKHVKLPYVGGALNFVLPVAASFIGADRGAALGDKIAPFRRSPMSAARYLRGPGGNSTLPS